MSDVSNWMFSSTSLHKGIADQPGEDILTPSPSGSPSTTSPSSVIAISAPEKPVFALESGEQGPPVPSSLHGIGITRP